MVDSESRASGVRGFGINHLARRLPRLMNLGLGRRALAVPLAAAALALGLAACGAEEETEEVEGHEVPFVVEGEPIELGDLRVNVQLTRFLNPNNTEDAEYLEGLPPPPADKDYLGVFLEAENEGDDPAKLPEASELTVTDTTGKEFQPSESDTVFALELGSEVEGHGEVPIAESAASSGPVQGSLVIFLVDTGVSENRPLEMDLTADGEQGVIELDI
jgi:hypothetical protein